MRITTLLYSLVLHAYPSDFRRENEEEILGTLMDYRETGGEYGPLRQAASLAHSGNRLRWIRGTHGSVAQTLRQGLAWGALILIARQAGLAIVETVRPLIRGWGYPSPLTALLALGWLLAFCLLASGRRRWGLGVLTAVLIGFVAQTVDVALSYGGTFSWAFTLHFFLPVVLPLLCAYLWPTDGIRLPARFSALLLVLAVLLPPLSTVRAPLFQLAAWGFVGIVVFFASLSDPRWAVATALVVLVPVIQSLIPALAGGRGLSSVGGALLLAVLVPTSALLLSFRGRRAAVPRAR